MKRKRRLPKVFIVILILVLVMLVAGFVIGNSIYNFALDPANYSYAIKDDDNSIDIKYIKDDYKNSAKKARTKSSDNQDLFGYYKQDEANHDWVMLVHGFNGIDETIPIANDLEKKGYNTLVTEKRGYGFTKNNKMSLGIKEKNDIASWTNYIKDIDNDANIYIYGLNMGANDALLSSADDLEGVEGIIVDSPIVNMDGYMDKFLRENFKYGGSMAKPILDKFMDYKLGYNTTNLGLDQSTKKSDIPIYYIFGEKDSINTKNDIKKLEESTNNFWGSQTRKGDFLGGYLNEVNVYTDKFTNLVDGGDFSIDEPTEADEIDGDLDSVFEKLAGKEFQYEGRWFNGIKFEENGKFYGLFHARVYEENEQLGGPDAFQSYCLFKGRLKRVPDAEGDVFTVADLKVTSDTGEYVALGPHERPPYKKEDLNILAPAKPTLVDQFGSEDQDYIIKFDENTFGIEKGINYKLTTNSEGKLELTGDRGIKEVGYTPEFVEFSSGLEVKESQSDKADASLDYLEGKKFSFDASGRWQTSFVFDKNGLVYGSYTSIYPPGDIISGYADRHEDACYFKGQFVKKSNDNLLLKNLKILSETDTYKVIGQSSDKIYRYEDLNILSDDKDSIEVSEFGAEKDGRSLVYFVDFPFGLEEGMEYSLSENESSKYEIDSLRNLNNKEFKAEFKELWIVKYYNPWNI